MVSRRKRFTREFKIETVKLVTGSDNSVAQIAVDMGIHPNTLFKWTRQYSDKPQEAFPGTGHMTPDAEMICQLKRENERLKMERDILKKSHGHLFQRPELIFHFMHDHQTQFPVTLMCSVFPVSRSGYYAWSKRPESKRNQENRELSQEIAAIHRESKGIASEITLTDCIIMPTTNLITIRTEFEITESCAALVFPCLPCRCLFNGRVHA